MSYSWIDSFDALHIDIYYLKKQDKRGLVAYTSKNIHYLTRYLGRAAKYIIKTKSSQI
jgi:hypothetical protein